MQRHILACKAGSFTHCQPRDRHPVLPVDIGERTRRRTVTRQTRGDRDKPLLLIVTGKAFHAVRRVRQAVQQYHHAFRLCTWHQNKRAITLIRKTARPYRAITIVTIERRFFVTL
ncbi:hypothetical protein D3C80_1260170 [compost metagenome]